ncbi:MAG TPA: sigma-70 family RNA polymerase sigma factor [Solirubrobacteraceae bacterium]|nr:sigma-70 family RNA polymerase sigma factor [Solirubrobacteraceae bacterium]
MRGPSPFLRLQSDEKLVQLTRRGNQAAYEVLVSRYDARLIGFTRHMLGSREDAEDVVQETFAAAYNAMVSDERPINVKPWLYRIARNRSLNHLRRNTAIAVDSFDMHVSEHGTTTADKVHKKEEFRQLMADVQDLPETQKTALLLREIDALSYDQIAEAMETTVPSVKSLLVRARVGLAEAAEARKLTCEDVREELGEVAEGLKRLSPPVRRHLRDCERCSTFRKSLKDTNKALALMLPIGPLLLIKKLVLAQLGTTASAGGTAAATTAVATGASTAATGGAISAGVSAVATKAAATVAAAAIVTAGAVEVDQAGTRTPLRTPAAAVVAQAPPATVPTKPRAVAEKPERTEKPAAVVAAKPAAAPAEPIVPVTAPEPAPAPEVPAAEPAPAEPVTPPSGSGPQEQVDAVTLPAPQPVEETPITEPTPEVVPPIAVEPETPTVGGQPAAPIEDITPPAATPEPAPAPAP